MSLITYAVDTCLTGGRGSPNAISPGSDANNWTYVAGDQVASFASNQIVATYNASTNRFVWTYAGLSETDQEVLVNITQTQSDTDVAGAVLRCSNSTHFYFAELGASANTLKIGKHIGGSETILASVSVTSSFGTKYSLRFQVIGDTLKAKLWDALVTEPAAWNAIAVDTDLSSGAFGIYGAPVGGSAVTFDTFSATNGSGPDATPVPTGSGDISPGLSAGAANALLIPPKEISNYEQWSLQIDTIATGGTITFQGSNDGINYDPILATNATTGTAATTTTSTGIFYAKRICRYIQAEQTAWTSGVTTGTLILHALAS